MEQKQGKVVVNITKKKRTTIDKTGKVVEQIDLGDDKKQAQDARAKKLGFK